MGESRKVMGWWLAGLFAVSVVAVGVWFLTSRPLVLTDLRSDPGLVRPWAAGEFDEMVAPVPSSGSGSDPEYLEAYWNVVVEEPGAGKVVVKYESSEALSEFVPGVEVQSFAAADGWVDGSRKAEIRWVAGRSNDPAFREEDYLKLATYTADLQMLNPADDLAKKEQWRVARKVWGNRKDPTTHLRMGLRVDGFKEPHWHLQGAFDAVTRVRLSHGGSWSTSGESCDLGTELDILHSTPVVVVMDVAHGEPVVYECAPGPGEVVVGKDIRIELLALVDGDCRSYSSGGADWSWTFEPRVDGKQECTALFGISPASMANSVKIEAIGEDGKVVKNAGSMGSGSVSFEQSAAEIAGFRIKVSPRQTRLLIELEGMPWVAGANVAPADLFDVAVPYVELERERDLGEAVSTLTELKLVGSVPSGPGGGGLSMSLHDTSPRRLVELYLAQNPDCEVVVDGVAQTIEFRKEPPKKPALERLGDWVKGLLP